MYTIQTSPERKLKLCAIPTCEGKRYDLVHKFPMNNERAQQWIDAIDMPELRGMPLDKVRKRFFICSKHFRPQDYKNCESRSLNTTAYPRLLLKVGIEECTEQSTTIVGNTTDELQVIEYIMADGGADIRETDVIDPLNTTSPAKSETKSSVQYVVCSPPQPQPQHPTSPPSNSVPILLRRNQKKPPEAIVDKSTRIQAIAQKTLPVKSVESPINRNVMGNRAVNIIEQKSLPNRYAAKRNAASAIESGISKKPHLDEMIADDIAHGLYIIWLIFHHISCDKWSSMFCIQSCRNLTSLSKDYFQSFIWEESPVLPQKKCLKIIFHFP